MSETNEPVPSLRTLLWRGMRRKCPRCGKGDLYKRWMTLHERCPVCGLQYLRNQGDLWAPLLLLDRALYIFPVIVLIYFRLNNPHAIWFYFLVGALLAGLIFTMPHRNGMALSLDYLMRRRWGDLSDEPSSPNTDQ